jgi:hypothetical protein
LIPEYLGAGAVKCIPHIDNSFKYGKAERDVRAEIALGAGGEAGSCYMALRVLRPPKIRKREQAAFACMQLQDKFDQGQNA